MSRRLLGFIVLAVLTVFVFSELGRAGFVQFDDQAYVVHNPDVAAGLTWAGVRWAFTTGHESNWHPLTWLSHMLDVSLFGVDPGPAHLINVLFHLVNACLLFWLLARATGANGPSFVVAALFAVHPLHVESVAWIAERKDVLSTCFWMLTTAAYVSYRRAPSPQRYAFVLAAYALGLMAKPMLVTLPFVLLLFDVWPLGGSARDARRPPRPTRHDVMTKVPLFALATASSVVTFLVQRHGGAMKAFEKMPFGVRAENAIVAYVRYLVKAVWPVNLIVYYPHPRSFAAWEVAACAVALVVASAAAIWQLKRRPYIFVGWFWYVGTLVPVIGLVQVGRQGMADRYTYVPLIGIFIVAVWGGAEALDWLRSRGRSAPVLKSRPARPRKTPLAWVPAAAAAAIIVALAATARVQASYWLSDDALWTHALTVQLGLHPRIARQAADDLLSETDLTPMLGLLETTQPAVEWRFLGRVFARHRQFADDDAAFATAVSLDPTSVDIRNDYGRARAAQGDFAGALEQFSAAVHLDTASVDAHRNAGIALAQMGRAAEAIEEFRTVLRLAPGDPAALQALAALGAGGR